jgi:hypothetical protein
VARFWWGGDDKKPKIHWKKWAKIAIPKSSGGMGFRDFQLFNQAMLAKQAWRLMDKPDSLYARVIRGKYFHDKDLLSSPNKRKNSHIWKAILHGREALKKGLIKRVGDGSSINVWEDPWIPSHIGNKLIVRRPGSEVHKVSDLIEPDLVQWNIAKITTKFYEPDISTICSIPIGRFTEDFWALDLEKSGNFTVRSCYRLLAAQHQDQVQQSSSSEHDKRLWKILWKIDVPPKVRGFWWRVINEFIPCRQVLKNKHMDMISDCKTCGAEEESIIHAFFECTRARLSGGNLKKIASIKIPLLHPRSWATDVILCGCWAVWQERNVVWHGE